MQNGMNKEKKAHEEKAPVIVGSNVIFAYRDRIILNNIDFSVFEGEHVGIVGESGCGKSTLLKLLAGLREPVAGSIKIAGECRPEKIRQQVSMVMQESMIMPFTVRENILLGREISDERLNLILKATKLEVWLKTLPMGVDTYLGNRANELSGGQAQRIAIARAMAKNSDIILLDEPTSALDRTTGEGVIEALTKLTEGKTVIHVTHQPDYLKDCSRILHMEDGKLYG